jgi:hypothetical protein
MKSWKRTLGFAALALLSCSSESADGAKCVPADANNPPPGSITVGGVSRSAAAAISKTPYVDQNNYAITSPQADAELSRTTPPTVSWQAPAGTGPWLFGLTFFVERGSIGADRKTIQVYTADTSYTLGPNDWAQIPSGSSLSVSIYAARMQGDCVAEGPYRKEGYWKVAP